MVVDGYFGHGRAEIEKPHLRLLSQDLEDLVHVPDTLKRGRDCGQHTQR